MQHIHVKRYASPEAVGYHGTIEPEDRSWIVFVRLDGEATLWRRVEIDTPGVEQTDHVYLDVELPVATTEGHPLHPPAPPPPPSAWPGPIDYEVTQQPDGRFTAWLNCRQIACDGATEHEALRNLLNYVAQLCVAGCLDHTGKPVPAVNVRRYKAVWPGTDLPATTSSKEAIASDLVETK